MPYSGFSLKDVKKKLGIRVVEDQRLFSGENRIGISDFLKAVLDKYVPLALAVNTEKSRSEWIIAPILAELKDMLKGQISVFSGKRLDVSPETGLDGYCDYIVSLNPEQYYIAAPVLTIIEAKKEDIIAGLGQCIAAMYAAKLFNEKEETEISFVYGAVTTGANWKFLKLKNQVAYIDTDEYVLKQLDILMGIFVRIVTEKSE